MCLSRLCLHVLGSIPRMSGDGGGAHETRRRGPSRNILGAVVVGLVALIVLIVLLVIIFRESLTAYMPLLGAVIASATGLGAVFLSGRAGNALDAEADKIRATVDPGSVSMVGPLTMRWVDKDGITHVMGPDSELSSWQRIDATAEDSKVEKAEAIIAPRPTVSALDKQEAILREIYTQGLAQAKLSFRVSLIFASIGAVLLFFGVGLAIWRAPTDGQDYASVVSLVAGVVVNAVSSLFFVQSNRTRRDMAQQGAMLREESQEDRRFSGARELVGNIDDDDLRDRTTADIALRLMSAVGVPTDETSGRWTATTSKTADGADSGTS